MSMTQTELSTPEHVKITSSIYSDPEWSTTTLNYYKDADIPPPNTENSTLSEHEMRLARRSDDSPHVCPTEVRILNIRGHETSYNIPTYGFKIGHLETKMQNWHSLDERKTVLFPEVSELLKRELGCKEVISYEHHIRSDSLENALQQDTTNAVDINGPVQRVHIDESPASARNEFAFWVLSQPSNEHLRNRHFGIFNIWKPLKTIYRDPLCLCNVNTLENEDLQSGKVTVPGPGEIENFSIRPPKAEGAHGFVYLREQKPDEVYIFRIFDSRIDEGGFDGSSTASGNGKRSHGVAHTSFVDPGTEGMEPRQSVEVRSFCVF